MFNDFAWDVDKSASKLFRKMGTVRFFDDSAPAKNIMGDHGQEPEGMVSLQFLARKMFQVVSIFIVANKIFAIGPALMVLHNLLKRELLHRHSRDHGAMGISFLFSSRPDGIKNHMKRPQKAATMAIC